MSKKNKTEADNLRAIFKYHQNEKNPAVIASLLAAGEADLKAKRHPDPYVRKYQNLSIQKEKKLKNYISFQILIDLLFQTDPMNPLGSKYDRYYTV
jgi:hypothetical protein